MNEINFDENNLIDLTETINDFESESIEASTLDEDYNFADSEEEEIARYEKIIRELTEFEESQKLARH